MRFAICNEMFGDMPFAQACEMARECGYEGIEWAPFTLRPGDEPFDVADVTASQRAAAREAATAAGLKTTGLHWLLAKTNGYYLTSPDAEIRQRTSGYLAYPPRPNDTPNAELSSH